MKIKIVLLLFVTSLNIAFAQKSQEGSLRLPPTPVAQNMTKYGNFSPSLFTGTNVVSIPLYEIKTQNLKVPITLEYSSNGVKVDDLPGLCGLSWNLKYGGVITREIRDEPDNITNSPTILDVLPHDVVRNIISDDDKVLLKDYLLKNVESGADSEPDLFVLNSQFGTAKFIISPQGEVIVENQSDLKIQFLDQTTGFLNGFLLIDGKGIKYYYNKKETSSTSAGSSSRVTGVTAWYLGEIVHPLGDVIDFNYTAVNYGGQYMGSERQVKASVVQYHEGDNQKFVNFLSNISRHYPANTSTFSFSGLFPQNIQTNIETVSFTTESLSSQGNTSVVAFEVKNKNNEVVDSFKFDYLATNSGRLFLSALTSKNKGKHQFSYYSPELFPSRFSQSQDHWGYFNNAANQSLLPNNKEFGTYANREPAYGSTVCGMLNTIAYPTGGNTVFNYESNKYPVTSSVPSYTSLGLNGKGYEYASNVMVKSESFILNSTDFRIQFGTVILAPECQSSTDPDVLGKIRINLRLKNLKTGQYVNFSQTNSNLTYYKGNVEDLAFELNNVSLGEPHQLEMYLFGCVKADFIFLYNKVFVNQTEDKMRGGVRLSGYTNNTSDGQAEHRTYKYGNLTGNKRNGIVPNDNGELYYTTDGTYDYFEKEVIIDPVYTASRYGKYRMYTLNSRANNAFDTRGYSIVYPVVTESGSGGATEYFYKLGFDSRAIPIIKNTAVDNFDFLWNNSSWGVGLLDSAKYYKFENEIYTLISQKKNTYNLSSVNSFQFDYFTVKKTFEGYEINHNQPVQEEIAYFDTYTTTDKNRTIRFPFYVCNGNHVHEWKISADGYRRCVAPGSTNTQIAFLSPFYDRPIGQKFTLPKTNNIEASKMSFYSNRYFLTQEQHISYHNNLATVNKRDFYYDNNLHFNPTREISESGDGKTTTVYTTYAQDYIKDNGIIGQLVEGNMVAMPIEKIVFKNNFVVQGQLFEYLNQGNIGKIKELQLDAPVGASQFKWSNLSLGKVPNSGAYSTFESDKRYSISISYLSFDNYGNPTEIKKLTAPSTVYVWGYGGQYPIAEIKNATYADILTVLTQATINNLNSTSQTEASMTTLIENAITKLRTDSRLSKAMVSSYTYRPLVGMTSKTDARGVTEYYQYDGMQRLKAVLDQVKNVTTSMDYHYRNN